MDKSRPEVSDVINITSFDCLYALYAGSPACGYSAERYRQSSYSWYLLNITYSTELSQELDQDSNSPGLDLVEACPHSGV